MKRDFDIKKGLRNNWQWIVVLLIFILAFSLRSAPGRYGELQALDPFHLYRMSEYIVNNNIQLPENDLLRYYPLGVDSYESDYLVPMYLPAITYVALSSVGLNMHYLHFAIFWPAMLGALAVVVMYLIGKELFDKKTGLAAAFFLATTAAFITRTSAGFFEKEGIAGLFTLLSIYLFIKAFKKSSWKYGILSGLSLAVVSGAWGGVRYFYLFYSGYLMLLFILAAIVLLLDNLFNGFEPVSKRIERFFGMDMVKAYVPTIILGIFLFQIFPRHESLTDFSVVLSLGVLIILLIRNGVEKLKLIDTDKIRMVIPALLVIGIITILIGSMFSDVLYGSLTTISNIISLNRPDVVGTTVAENAPGTWANVVGMTGTNYSGGLIPWLNFLAPYAALWIFMILGIFLLFYRFYRTSEWILFFPIVWMLTAIWGVFYAVRLVFLLGPPASLLGGFFLAWLVERIWGIHKKRQKKSEKTRRFGILQAMALIILALVVLINFASAYVYSNGLGPSICIANTGNPCVTVQEDGSLKLDEQQPWYQAMDYLSQTGQDNSVLSWWDFGYWFQTRGNKPSVADGGNLGGRYADRDHRIADWFTAPTTEWYNWTDWMENMSVEYILMDYTLPGKYGAISKIASEGEQIVGFLEFSNTGIYPKENETVYIFGNGPYEIWVPFDDQGSLTGTPTFLAKQGDQYQHRSYINDVCTAEYGIIRLGEETPSLGGCVALLADPQSQSGIRATYLPPEAEHTIFSNLMFMQGHDLPVEKVFDNYFIQIYMVRNNEAVPEDINITYEIA